MTAVRTDMMTWPPLLPFRQPIFARYPSRDFVVPFFISVVIHAFLLFLFRFVITDRTTFEPTAPSIDTHLIVSLTIFDTASQDELDREAASVVPDTGPPVEHKAEAESIVTSIGQEIPGSEIPDVKTLATDEIPSIDLEAIYPIDWELGRTSELELETVVPLIDLGIPDLEITDGNTIAIHAIPSIDPKAIHPIDWKGIWVHRVAPEETWMSESEILLQRYEFSMFIIKRNRALLPPDCRTAYANMGQLGIAFLIRDAITGDGCKW